MNLLLPLASTPVAEAMAMYIRIGWPVLPLAGKVPLTGHGWRDASLDPEQVRRWALAFPSMGVGVVTYGSIVVDVDGADGLASLRRLAAVYGPLPDGPTAKTPKGWHRVLRWPDGAPAPRRRIGLVPHVDIISPTSGYIAAPPANRRRWVRTSEPHAAASWLVNMIVASPAATAPAPVAAAPAPVAAQSNTTVTSPPPPGAAHTSWSHLFDTIRRTKYADAALKGELAEMAGTPEGQRHNQLVRSWKRLTLDLGDVLDREQVREQLTAAALMSGLPALEIERTLR